MLARLVLNSWPCDVPTFASQSSGITGVSHRAQPSVWLLTLFFCKVVLTILDLLNLRISLWISAKKSAEFFFFIFLRNGVTLSPRLECNGENAAHCSLSFLGWSNPTTASWVAGTIGTHQYGWLFFFFKIGSHCILHLPGSGDCLTSATWVAGTTGTHHHAQLIFVFFVETEFHCIGQAGLKLLTLWFACFGLPKCLDYRLESLRKSLFLFSL